MRYARTTMRPLGDGLLLALAALILVGCVDDGGFELRVQVTASGPDEVEGTSGDLSFHLTTAAAAIATPPIVVVTDGAGPHSFAVAFDCSFARAHEDPIQVDVFARLWRDGTTLALSLFTHSCLYANGVTVAVDLLSDASMPRDLPGAWLAVPSLPARSTTVSSGTESDGRDRDACGAHRAVDETFR